MECFITVSDRIDRIYIDRADWNSQMAQIVRETAK